MDSMLERITLNPNVMAGKPTIRGLRISVEHTRFDCVPVLHLHHDR